MYCFNIKPYVIIQSLIAGCLNLGEMINGYGVAWSAPVLPKFDDPHQSPFPYAIAEYQKLWIVTILFFGCIGSYFGGYLSNKIGRKKSLVIGGVLYIIANTILTVANNLVMFYFGRFLVGFCMSFLSVTGLIYIGEIASPNIRGTLLTCMGVFHALGGLLVYCVGPFVDYPSVGYVILGLNVAYVIGCCFIPESPMYYVLLDDEKSAHDALQYLGREDADSELKTMIAIVSERQNTMHIWSELVSQKSNRRSLFITVFLYFFQLASGIMAVLLYANTIFRDAGSTVHPDIATIIIGVTFVLGTCFAPMFEMK